MERTNLIQKTKLFALSISETIWAMGTSTILPAQFLLMYGKIEAMHVKEK